MTPPPVGSFNSSGADDTTDGYDTIDWLTKNLPESNGKVGMIGSSYEGFTIVMALLHPHPALKAAAPESPMVDGWIDVYKRQHGDWPLITLNLDFKDNKPEHLAAVLALLRKYQPWLSSAVKRGPGTEVQPLDVKPVLVLTGEADEQQSVFYDQLQDGDRVLVFGAIHTEGKEPTAVPEILGAEKASNYRRWWNNPWDVVEAAGQPHACLLYTSRCV